MNTDEINIIKNIIDNIQNPEGLTIDQLTSKINTAHSILSSIVRNNEQRKRIIKDISDTEKISPIHCIKCGELIDKSAIFKDCYLYGIITLQEDVNDTRIRHNRYYICSSCCYDQWFWMRSETIMKNHLRLISSIPEQYLEICFKCKKLIYYSDDDIYYMEVYIHNNEYHVPIHDNCAREYHLELEKYEAE